MKVTVIGLGPGADSSRSRHCLGCNIILNFTVLYYYSIIAVSYTHLNIFYHNIVLFASTSIF